MFTALGRLLTLEPALGRAVVFDLLAGEPRVKPSRGLLIDPDDACRARWTRRVVAAAALLSSPGSLMAREELLDELSDDPQLAADVLEFLDAGVGPQVAGLDDRQRATLTQLRR